MVERCTRPCMSIALDYVRAATPNGLEKARVSALFALRAQSAILTHGKCYAPTIGAKI